MDGLVPFPPELRPYRATFEPYLAAKLRQFGGILIRRLSNNLTPDQIRLIVDNALLVMQQQDAAAAPQRPLRLVIRHDCQSTGCGDMSCMLCQYNPSRLCTRNVKQKYLIDDHLKAKCGAPLRVELVDDTGTCHAEGLPPKVQLEMHVLNGEKYKEQCPDNTLLSMAAIKSCIIMHHTKALLRREGMGEERVPVYLPLERGAATVSDLTLTTSSEALLSGKAPTFRLLVWAVESNGEPVPHVTYVVSESFVVATKRVKHAIKSDIPSVGDHISKLLHIGKATVDKLTDLRAAFTEEGFGEVKLPDHLIRVDKVGQFRQLVEMSEGSPDLKNKLRHVLKLSPEKWDEVCQHALSAVVPDFRNRVWWCPSLGLGLLYACKNGAILMENPIGIVRLGATVDAPHQIIALQQLSPSDFNAIPRLKSNAVQNWYMPAHPQWAIYESTEDGTAPAPPPNPQSPVPVAAAAGAGPSGTAATAVGMLPMGAGMGGMQPPGVYGMPGAPPSPVMGGLGPTSGGGASGGGYGGGEVYGQPGGIAYGVPGGLPVQLGPAAGHRTSSSSPFALMQPQQQVAPQQQQLHPRVHAQQQPPQQQQPVQAQAMGQGAGGTAARERCGSGSGPPAAGGQGSGSSSGLMGARGTAAGGMMGGAVLQPPATAAAGGSSNIAGRSPFAADNMMQSIADAFPKFHGLAASPHEAAGARGQHVGQNPNDSHGPTAQHLAAAGHGQQPDGAGTGGSLMFALDMLKTDELMDPPLHSLTGGSTEWAQHLHGIGGSLGHLGGHNSYTMIDAVPAAEAAAGGGAPLDIGAVAGRGGGAGGGADGPWHGPRGGGSAGGDGYGGCLDSERRLSMKLTNALSLEGMIADHHGA